VAKLTLDQKLNAIYKQIAFIGKGGENTSQHYKYVRASDVTNAVRAAFVDNNIYVLGLKTRWLRIRQSMLAAL
jgi:hypothetical protein